MTPVTSPSSELTVLTEELPEVWKPVCGYEGLYDVSNFGRVLSLSFRNGKTNLPRKRLLKPHAGRYLTVTLSKNGNDTSCRVHTLVLTAFGGPRPHGKVCCHGDGNRHNNALTNLRWGTHKENEADKAAHGTVACGEKHGNAYLTDLSVIAIRTMHRSGIPIAKCALVYGVSKKTAEQIIYRLSWKHVSCQCCPSQVPLPALPPQQQRTGDV